MKKIQLICAALLLIALADTQQLYLETIKLVIFVSSMYIIIDEMDTEERRWLIPIALVAILMNPIIPFHFANASISIFGYMVSTAVFLLKASNYPITKQGEVSEAF
ncbi:MAG: hypothetical protein ACI8QD_000711 [Cyclobacteriaceae bacterium]|jgi:hypothetical protein